MAKEIKIPCNFWRHPSRNANAYEDTLVQANNEFVPIGLFFPDTLESRICWEMSEPVPQDYGATPNPILRVYWKIAESDTSNPWQYQIEAESFTPETDPEDETTWTLDSTGTDTSTGATRKNFVDISLSTLTIAKDDFVLGTLARDAQVGNGSDTLAANVMITHILFLADT